MHLWKQRWKALRTLGLSRSDSPGAFTGAEVEGSEDTRSVSPELSRNFSFSSEMVNVGTADLINLVFSGFI